MLIIIGTLIKLQATSQTTANTNNGYELDTGSPKTNHKNKN